MAISKAYDLSKLGVNGQWENAPSKNTPLNEVNLNDVSFALNTIDNRVVEMYNAQYNASEYAQQAKESANVAKGYKDTAVSSSNSASLSEQNAKNSEINSKLSETNSKASQKASSLSENNAKISEYNSKTSEINAKNSMDASKKSELKSEENANKAKSYAVGTNGAYRKEDVYDNAKSYYEQCKEVSQSISGVVPMGSIHFIELSYESNKVKGYMFSISEDFTTDNTFKHGAGYYFPKGTNVIRTADGYWDALPGSLEFETEDIDFDDME